ncbi:MAG TPA: hypothetical protein P5123_09625 [Spirochaetota bacterium]|nr:hypothetical protein [Spirochaetota bacterium]
MSMQTKTEVKNEGIVAIAALKAKVYYWTRVSEGLCIKSAGYTDDSLLEIEKYMSLISKLFVVSLVLTLCMF